jgi:prepilin-type N-terminal cleavage/methylation domain-containing protein
MKKIRSISSLQSGYTIIEMLTAVLIIGILSSISIPSWLGLMDKTKINNAQTEIHHALYQAHRQGMRQKIVVQVSFREKDSLVEWSIHPARIEEPTTSQQIVWNKLDPSIEIDKPETTFQSKNDVWRIQFNHKGNANGQIGRITIKLKDKVKPKRCVFVSTLIGTLREGKENPKPKDNKYCY